MNLYLSVEENGRKIIILIAILTVELKQTNEIKNVSNRRIFSKIITGVLQQQTWTNE